MKNDDRPRRRERILARANRIYCDYLTANKILSSQEGRYEDTFKEAAARAIDASAYFEVAWEEAPDDSFYEVD